MIDRLSCHYFNRGLSYAYEDRTKEAMESLKLSVALNRRNTPAWNLLGVCCYESGRFGMAEYCWKQSINNGDTCDAYNYLDSFGDKIRAGKPVLDKAAEYAVGGLYRKAYAVIEKEIPEELLQTEAVREFTMALRRESRPALVIFNALKQFGRKKKT